MNAIDITSLIEMDDEEFAAEMTEHLFSDDWGIFLDVELAPRTKSALNEIRTSLMAQLARHGANGAEPREPGWSGRAHGFRVHVEKRIAEASAVIKEINRQESATAEAYDRKWAAFAQRLAEALGDSDMAFMLDEITMDDGRGIITAGDWLDARKAKSIRQALAGKNT